MAIKHQIALATTAHFTPPSYLMRALLPFLICTMMSQPSAFAHPNQVTDPPGTPRTARGRYPAGPLRGATPFASSRGGNLDTFDSVNARHDAKPSGAAGLLRNVIAQSEDAYIAYDDVTMTWEIGSAGIGRRMNA